MPIIAAVVGTTNISTGEFNGRITPAGDITNTPYYVQIVETNGSIEVVESLTGLVLTTINTTPAVVAALNQTTLSGAIYDDKSIGATVVVVDWNATGTGCVLQKIDNTNDDYQDWIVVATDGVADTGAIGVNPI
jgi:hypothetical protein